MTILCGPVTETISYVSKSICGYLVKIYDIKSIFPDIIDIKLDNQIIPGVGDVSVSIGPEFIHRATIRLLSKNTGAGTATISFAIESIEIPIPPVEEITHNLDIYVKPYSWYGPGGAADRIIGAIGDINGTILNTFSEIGVTDYQYVSTEILSNEPPGMVTIRINLRQLSTASMAAPLLVAIAPLILKLLVIIIILGVITGWKFKLTGFIEQITGEKYSKQEVIGIVDKVKEEQLEKCKEYYSDPNDSVGCDKAVISGAADGLSDALDIPGADSDTLRTDAKIDSCLAEYNIDGDKAKYDACIKKVSDDATKETKEKAPKEPTDIMDALLFGGLLLGGLYIISRNR